MKELSPIAQAVLDAVCNNTEPDCDTQHLIAAALRVAAASAPHKYQGGERWIRAGALTAIATELEADQ